MKKLFTLFFLLISPILYGQTTGNGGSSPWLVLTNEYDTSPFNDTTDVEIYFDGSSYNGYVTSLQFKIAYDGVTFDSLYTIKSNLSNDYIMSYNEDQDNDEVLVSLVYMGASKVTSFPDTAIVTLKMSNIAVKLLYSNEQNITAFTFAGYSAVGSNSNGTDISIGTYSHGGAVSIPHRKYSGYVVDYGTNKGIPNLEYQLYRGNSLITTVLGGQPTKTTSNGYYEMVYYEHYYGFINNNTTDFDFLFKTEDIDSDNALSTADAYKQLLYANGKIELNAYQRLASDVNHSHTSTIADSYVMYGYSSGAYTNWSTLGAGGYRDVMFIKPEQIRYLEADSTVNVAGIGLGPLGISPQETNWTYDLNAYNTITTHDVNFYVVIMGDINLTSLGGNLPPNGALKSSPTILYPTQVNTSIIAQLPDQTVSTGDEFLVDLTLNTSEKDVHSFNFELDYDPDVLEFVNASTPYLPNAWQLYFNADSLGNVKYGGLDASTGNFPIRTDTMETIIQFTFKAKSVTGIGETPIEFGDKYNTGDNKGDDFTTEVIDGKVYLHVVSPVIDEGDFPKGFRLNQNYPNPFNPNTKITFSIINPQRVSLDIYDIHGRFIENIYKGFNGTGTYSVDFSGINLSSGVYLYRLTTERGVETKKLTLIK
jgi:hypothetical protein